MSEKSVIIDPNKAKAEMKNEAKEKVNFLSKKDMEKVQKILEMAKLPIEINDEDFKLGEREIDIRKLSKENKEQLKFRIAMRNSALLYDISQTQGDILRTQMAILRKLGVENLTDYLSETIDIIVDESKKLK